MSLLKIKRLSQSFLIVFLLLFPSVVFSAQAVYLDGSAHIDLGAPNWHPSNAFTLEASIKPDQGNTSSSVIANANYYDANFSFVYENGGISLYVGSFYSPGVKKYTSSFVLPFDSYTYVAVVNTESVYKIYFNGVEYPLISSDSSYVFSATYVVGDNFKGFIDAVTVTPNIKSAAEIAATAENGLDCGPHSAGCWLFEDNLLDSSGNGRNGSFVGSVGLSGFLSASAPGGSASSFPFGSSGGSGSGGSGSVSGVGAAFGPVGNASGLASGVGALAGGAAGLLTILAAYRAVTGALGG